MKKRSIIGLSALALSVFALASCGGSSSSATTSSSTSVSTVTSVSTETTPETTTTSNVSTTSNTPVTSSDTPTSSTTTSVVTTSTTQTYNFTCNLISGVYGTAKVTHNDGAQYDYISGTTFKLYEYSDGITFEYENSNTYNVKAMALVNGVEKASAVIGAANNKNKVSFSLLKSDITGDVVVNFEQTTETPVYNVAPEKSNANLEYTYKLTGSSVADKAIESYFKLEEGYENLVITATNKSKYVYNLFLYKNGSPIGVETTLEANGTATMTIPFSSITNDLVIIYEVVKD